MEAREFDTSLIGRTITAVRQMTDEETDAMGWDYGSIIIELDGGELELYAMSDAEGNDSGTIMAWSDALDRDWYVSPEGGDG